MLIFIQNVLAWFKLPNHGIFRNITCTECPVASGFSLVLSQGVACSISFLSQQSVNIKTLFFLSKNCYLWQVLLMIQKYPKWCLYFTLRNFITSKKKKKIQMTKYTNLTKYIQYIKNACIGNSVPRGQRVCFDSFCKGGVFQCMFN